MSGCFHGHLCVAPSIPIRQLSCLPRHCCYSCCSWFDTFRWRATNMKTWRTRAYCKSRDFFSVFHPTDFLSFVIIIAFRVCLLFQFHIYSCVVVYPFVSLQKLLRIGQIIIIRKKCERERERAKQMRLICFTRCAFTFPCHRGAAALH